MNDAFPTDLFAGFAMPCGAPESFDRDAVLLRGFAAEPAVELYDAVGEVAAGAPFRHMQTPGGRRMSVAMTCCGEAGWVSERAGYRYAPRDPESGRAWPAMPGVMFDLASRAAAAAGFDGFVLDSCLINRYVAGARLTLHQDRNERDFAAPIVSVSLGLTATFLWGGLQRGDPVRRTRLESGDVVVWGGASRLVHHGVAPLAEGYHPLTGASRINLTFRKAL